MIHVKVVDQPVTVSVFAVPVLVNAPAYEVIETGAEIYDGEYEWTPTREEQIVPIAGKAANQNIKINPIPQNYGLITYDGFGIAVS